MTNPSLPVMLGALLASFPCSCRAPAPLLPQYDEVVLAASSRTIVRGERFDLYSPYGEARTAELEAAVAAEVGRVQQLFADEDPRPLTIYVRTVEPGEQQDRRDVFWRLRPSLDGLRGATVDRRFMVMFLPALAEEDTGSLDAALSMQADVLRHELVHMSLYRMGIDGPPWLHEGVAHDVESMTLTGDGRLVPDPLPSAFLAARSTPDPPGLAELTRSSSEELNWSAHSAVRRWRCQALTRFLMQRSGGRGWREALACVGEMSDAEVVALEPEFEAWLDALDPLGRVRELVRSGDPEQRHLGTALLSIYSERDPQAMGTGEGDAMALEVVDDPACRAAASRYLIFFGAKRLTPAQIERLDGSDDRVQQLTALAIHKQRHEPVDLDRARALDAALTPAERPEASIAVYMLLSVAGQP